MDEKLMQFLHEQFNKIDERFNNIDERFNKIDERFDDIKDEISIIKEQTARNSELAYSIEAHEKRISDLETDIKVIKKAIGN